MSRAGYSTFSRSCPRSLIQASPQLLFVIASIASSAENATSRHDHARPVPKHRVPQTFFGSPAPHCARAHGHAEHALRLPASASLARMPTTRPQRYTCTPAHQCLSARRRSRQPLDPVAGRAGPAGAGRGAVNLACPVAWQSRKRLNRSATFHPTSRLVTVTW